VTAAAWPFLVSRSRNAGYRVVVVPGFMVVSQRDAAAVGWLSTSEETGPAEAIVKEMKGLATGPVTAVFRNFLAAAQDYLPDGRGLLKDGSGRPIIVTEGVILRLTGPQTTELGLTTADLSKAHDIVRAAFGEFWQLEDGYPQQRSRPFPAGRAADGTMPLTLRDAEPAPTSPPRQTQPPGPSAYTSSTYRAPRPRWRLIAGAGAAAAATCLAALGIYHLVSPPRPVYTSQQAQFLADFCGALVAGEPGTAYALTTPAFDATTTETAFAAELLNGYGRAHSCTPTKPPSTSADAAAITLVTMNGMTETWDMTLVTRNGELGIDHLQKVLRRRVAAAIGSSGVLTEPMRSPRPE
jgi:hypothetical protein